MKRAIEPHSGFTLLEVLVSLAILAICLTVILRIFSGTAGATRIAAGYMEATQIAETQMALLTSLDNPPAFDRGRVDDRYRWSSEVREFKPDLNNPLFRKSPLVDPENIYVPYQYRVTVTWGERKERRFQLHTIRLGVRE